LQLITQVKDRDAAEIWLDDSLTIGGIEGVVAKRDEPYPRPNVSRWQKVRRLHTMDVLVYGFAGEPQAPRLVVGLEHDGEPRILGTTLPLAPADGARLETLLPLSIRAERPVWSRFDSNYQGEWYAIPAGLVAEVSYGHLDGSSLRQAARFLRWRLTDPEGLSDRSGS